MSGEGRGRGGMIHPIRERCKCSFPGLPRFCSCFSFSIIHGRGRAAKISTSVYYTERKPNNKNGGDLGMRLQMVYSKCSYLKIYADV